MLQTTNGYSIGAKRTNSEVDLIRSSTTTDTLLLFIKLPVTDKVIEGIKRAKEIATHQIIN